MQIIKCFLNLFIFVLPVCSLAQSTYIPQQSEDIHFLDRQEILAGSRQGHFFTAVRPYSRNHLISQAAYYDSVLRAGNRMFSKSSSVRIYDQDYCRIRNANGEECLSGPGCDPLHRRSLGSFYKNKTDFFQVNNKDFFLSVNPVLQFMAGVGSADSQRLFLNSRGITVRGRIAHKVGFSSTIIENQERGPDFYSTAVRSLDAVPGAGFYKSFKKAGYDYFDARGYITFNAAKFIDFQFGFDKNFIGNGYRSLFLSDWGNSYLFLKLNTRIWKLNYQNLFMELIPEYYDPAWNVLMDRKYTAMHHLSFNATPWLNVGLFESVVFGRKNHFDFQYLNPIIFFRHIEGQVGSPDNAMMGLDAKANIRKRVQLYGQFLIDEFLIKKVMNDPTGWVNKFGFQLGGKYINAFGIPFLDLQVEMNRIRPFTYSHFDSVANYTHYNQPLAHPLGANFQELIGIVRYRPAPRWNVMARGIYYYKGLDSAGRNFGGNIFRDYDSRDMESGYKVGSGAKAQCFNGYLKVSFELKSNLYLELAFQQRLLKPWEAKKQSNTLLIGGLRWNMWPREYDY